MKSAARLMNHAEKLEECGLYKKAERTWRRALSRQSRIAGESSLSAVPYLYGLGLILYANEKNAAGAEVLERLLALLIKHYGPCHEEVRDLREQMIALEAEDHDAAFSLDQSA